MEYKKECPLCGVKGRTQTYWSSTAKCYKLKVICENKECVGNKLK